MGTATASVPPVSRWQMNLGGTGTRMGARERMLLTERLLLLLETGVSLHQALRELHAQERHPGVAAVLDAVSGAVLEGQPLSVALAPHGALFPPTYIALVNAGERGGFLPQVLQQLLEMDEQADRLRSTIASALSYPIFLIVFSLAVIVFVLVGVFPKFADMFEQIRNDLPWSTRVLMALSDGLRLHWPWVMAALGGLTGGAAVLLRRPDVLERLDALKLGLPGLRTIYQQIYLSQTLRVLGLSLAHGVPLVDALRACQDLVPNRLFRRFMADLREQVTEGRGLAQGFQHSPLVPTMVRQMITTGEDSGNLAKVMTRIAEFYDRELNRRIALISRLAEPVMLLVMGALVGLIVASLILPIFKLSRAVH
ncbi:type II secretion system F family protein [Sphaerotilus microaerophilus]|uniref:Phytochrome sensor protein n=1 Tax=Sphaerotilus microaerophilus TaxID=2914710 RepID=A0ABN6PLM5_9BURK|nr:type II secretion system F family protein [Sphaerotilus sp. FB-5]BDI04691.1 phytochrome sensor protein [Sphaerotilus sp. FB-5]